jgi:hypothetical protein
MNYPSHCLAAAVLSLSCNATPIAHESFDYAASSSLSTQGAGSGWSGAWYQDGEPAVTGAAGLGFSDALGNVLNASGRCADTTGTATTRSLRAVGSSNLNNVWISFLYQLPASNNKFEGVSFYRGSQQVFTVSNPSTTGTAAIFLTSNLTGGPIVNTGSGVFGKTHFVVLKLNKGGGNNGTDRIEAFIDPDLVGSPSTPTVVDGANFDFDRIRIAGQDGSTLLVDEIRIGDSFADVTPHVPVAGLDSDGDGLSDTQESALGLDPHVSNATLIDAIKAHPEWFGLYSNSGIMDLGNGGVILQKTGGNPVDLIFEVQHSENLTQWSALETINRIIDLPSGKNFLRVTLQDR